MSKQNGVLCVICGSYLTPKQISANRGKGREPKYCSRKCRCIDYKAYANTDAVKEPRSQAEEQELDEAIRQGRIELRNQAALGRTPKDDTPEAERKLRERICPDGIEWSTLNQRYEVKIIQDPTHLTKPRYME